MTRLTVDPQAPDPEDIGHAADVLRRGGVVAYPTETFYGLAVDPCSDEAVRRLFGVKDRDPAAPIALIAADAVQAEGAGAFGRHERLLASALWPGPLTIVVRRSPRLSPMLVAAAPTVGVRVPSHQVALALARAFGSCITATSANRSGHPPASTAAEVAAALADRVDVLIDAGPTPGGPPSTVVEVVDGVPRLHRAGAVSWDRVLESLE